MSVLKEILFYIRSEPFGWLSNFERSPQVIDNITYPTNEHYYQSKKAKSVDTAAWIITAPNPYLAMKAGRSLRENEMRKDWEKIKFDVMLTGLRAKFNQNPSLKMLLLATGDLPIHEDSPTDMVWGIKGQDWLGRLLMHVREELRTGVESPIGREVSLSSVG